MEPTIIHPYEMHPLDRRGQQETFDAVLKWYFGPKQYLILSADTGLGKTAIIAALSRYTRILSLVSTKLLQDDTYGEYRFPTLKGKANYPCAFNPDYQADVCAIPAHITGQAREAICQSGGCQYYEKLYDLCYSPRACLNYSKYLSDGEQDFNRPGVLALDEAHELPEIVIESSGFATNIKLNRFLKGYGPFDINDDIPIEQAIEMMRRMYRIALVNIPSLEKTTTQTTKEIIRHRRRLKRHQSYIDRIVGTAKRAMGSEEQGHNIWHFSTTYSGEFSAKPITASADFKSIMRIGRRKCILLSATITPMIADMLGIEKSEFEFYEASRPYPAYLRPVYDLNVKGMGHKQTKKAPALWSIQSVKISNILKQYPEWSAVILTSSKAKGSALAGRLKALGHDVFTPPLDIGTDKQLEAWKAYRKPGAVCISHNFWTGVSLREDRLLFIASIRFPDISTPLEKARMGRSMKEFLYRAAVYLVQGCGRNQRGFLEDYLPVGQRFVFLADGNYKRVKAFAPGDFKERLRPWED